MCSDVLSNVQRVAFSLAGKNRYVNVSYKLTCKKAGWSDVLDCAGGLKELVDRVKSKDFQNRILRNFVYLGVKWANQAPTIIGIMIEIVQLLDNVLGLINIDMMELSRKIAEFVQGSMEWLSQCATKVSTRAKGPLQTEPQSLEGLVDDWSISALCAGVATILGGLILGAGATSFGDGWKVIKRYSEYGRSISNLERGARSAWTIAESVFGALQRLFENILGRKTLKVADQAFAKHNISITDYVDQINAFVDPLMSFDDMKKIRTGDYMVELRNCANKVEGLLLHDMVKISATAKQITLGKIKEFRDFMRGNNFRAGDLTRRIPFGVTFVGKPGCGKSLASNLLAKKLTEFGVVENSPYKQDDIYFWMPIKKFMDNYEQQAIMVIDDLACTTDAAGTEAPEHKLLQMFSDGAYYPEFARLEDKGRAFISEVIIASTNTAWPEYKSLRDPVALHRRRNLLIHQEKIGPDGHLMENWRFKLMHPVKPAITGDGFIDNIVYTFEEIVALVVVNLEAWRKSESTNISEIKINPKFKEALRNKEKFSLMETLDQRAKRFEIQPIQTEPQNLKDVDDDVDDIASPIVLEMEGAHWVDIPLDSEGEEEEIEPTEEECVLHTLKAELKHHLRLLGMEYIEPQEHNFGTQLLPHVERQYDGFIEKSYVDHNGCHRLLEDTEEFWSEIALEQYELAWDFAIECGWPEDEIMSEDTLEYYVAFLNFAKDVTTNDRTNLQTEVQMVADFEEIDLLTSRLTFSNEGEKWYEKYQCRLKSMASSLEDTWYNRTRWIDDESWEYCQMILGILTGVVGLIAIYKTTQWLTSKTLVPLLQAPEGLNYDNRKDLAQTKVYLPENLQYNQTIGLKPVKITMPEGCANLNTRAMLQGTIRQNTYWLNIRGNGMKASSNATVLRGTDVIFPKHDLAFWEHSPDMELEFELVRDTDSRKEMILKSKIMIHPRKDFALVRMSSGKLHSHKSLVEWMATEDSLGRRVGGFKCATVCIEPEDGRKASSYHYGVANLDTADVRENGVLMYQAQGYDCSIQGGKGLCGRLLVDTTAGLDKPIVGLHVSGVIGADNSFFYPLSKKDIEYFDSVTPLSTAPQALSFPEIAKRYESFFTETEDIVKIKEDARIKCDGYEQCALLSNRLATKPNFETQFEPTLLHDKIMENVHAPSPLGLFNQGIDPAVRAEGIEPQQLAEPKYQKKTNPFEKKHLEFAKEALTSLLMPMTYHDWSVKGLDEALNGDNGFLKPMDMHTSPGVEMQKLADGHKGKHAFVRRMSKDDEGNDIPESEQKWIIRDEEHKPTGVGGVTNRGRYLLDDLERIETDLKEGRETFTAACSSMKDETLPKAKVWIAKVRLFMTLAMSITILTRRYFGAFLAASVAYCTVIPLAIGLDAYGPQWTLVFRRMNRWGGRCIAADFKSFDSQADGECMLNAAEAISDIYDIKSGKPDPIGRKVRFGLIYLFIHTYVVCRNLLYRKCQGMPSGVPVTAPLNSCVNVQYLIMCVKALTDEAGFNYSVNQIISMLEILVYGDDFVLAIHPDLEGIITFRTMRNWLARYQIVITPETKTGEDYDYRTMTNEVTFLKRKWAPEPGDSTKIRAPIEMETIAGIINWQRKKHPKVPMMMSLIEENYLQELFHHGREAYVKGLTALNAALEKERAKGKLPSQMRQHYVDDYAIRHQLWLEKFN